MERISSQATVCLGLFRETQRLVGAPDTEDRFRLAIPADNLSDEVGRFRVWCSNLGALQRGHSSLDYRLRDSPLLFSNVMKLLKEMEANLSEAIAVLSHRRKPYEDRLGDFEQDEDSSSVALSEDESDEDELPGTELGMRLCQLGDINDNLFRLSIRIRSPTLRTRGLKAASYRELDKDTDVDVLQQYAEFDRKYLEDAFRDLRADRAAPGFETSYLLDRLSSAITRRRQQFKYWRRHRAKLSFAPLLQQVSMDTNNGIDEAPVQAVPMVAPDVNPGGLSALDVAPKSEFAPRSTIFSGTEVTAHHKTLDEPVDSMSVTSVATTARDLGGQEVEVPSAPEQAVHGRDFECPYCFAICPARYGDNQRSWRSHLFQDLQPYICTYPNCLSSEQLFRSRREWIAHEQGHRKLWQCPMHVHAVYDSRVALERHFVSDHADQIALSQLDSVISAVETSGKDLRDKCPVCFASANMQGGLSNHVANHLERFALFSLPRDIALSDEKDRDDNRSGKSNAASEGWKDVSEASGSDRQLDDRTSDQLDQNIKINSGELAICEDSVDDALRRILFVTEQNSELDDAKTVVLSLRALKSSLAAIRASYASDCDSMSVINHDLALITSCLRKTLTSFRVRFFDAGLQPRAAVIKNLWRELNVFFERQGYGIAERFELYRMSLQSLQAVHEGDSFDADFLASMRHNLSVLSQEQGLADAGGTKFEDTHGVKESSQIPLMETSSLSVPASTVGVAQDSFMPHSHWASKVFDQSYPMTKMEPTLPSRFFAQPDPAALQKLISGGFAEVLVVIADVDARIRFYHRASDDSAYILISQKPRESSTVTYYSKPLASLRFVRANSGVSLRYRDTPSNQETWAFIRCSIYERMILLLHTMSALKAQSPNFLPDISQKVKDVILSQDETILFNGELEEAHGHTHALRVISKITGSQPRIEISAMSGPMTNRVILCAFIGWEVLSRTWAEAVNDYKVRVSHLRPHVFVPESWHMSPDEGPFVFTFTSKIAGALIASLDYIRGSLIVSTKEPPSSEGRIEQPKEQTLDPTADQSRTPFQPLAVPRLSPRDPNKLLRTEDIPTVEQLHTQRYFRAVSRTKEQASSALNTKVSVVVHDITKIQVDAIVNSAHHDLLARGERTTSVAIARAAGPQLTADLRAIGRCEIGSAVITPAYQLPCKAVIHAVGPTGSPDPEKDRALRSAYIAALKLAVENGIRTIALPAIATGHHSYPEKSASSIGVAAVREFLSGAQGHHLDRVIFCLFSERSRIAYEGAIPEIFPGPVVEAPPPTEILSPELIMTMAGERFSPSAQDSKRIGLGSKLAVVLHDITKVKADAIISAAHENLVYSGASQLIGSVQQAGGPGLVNACRQLRRCSKGEAVSTPGFELPSKTVIHVVGPDHSERFDEQKRILASCYRSALSVALQNGSRVIAIPDLSSLRAEVSREEVARIATDETLLFLRSHSEETFDLIIFCLLRRKLYDTYSSNLTERLQLNLLLNATSPSDEDDFAEKSPFAPAGTTSTAAIASQQARDRDYSPTDQSNPEAPWVCCRCRAQPLVSRRCLNCSHRACDACNEASLQQRNSMHPSLWLCELWTPEMKVLSRHQWAKERAKTEPGPTRDCIVPRERLSIDTLKYYHVPFHFLDESSLALEGFMTPSDQEILLRHTAALRSAQHTGIAMHRLPHNVPQELKLNKSLKVALYFAKTTSITSKPVFGRDVNDLMLPWPFVSAPPGAADGAPLHACDFLYLGAQWHISLTSITPLFAVWRNRTRLRGGANELGQGVSGLYKLASGDFLAVRPKEDVVGEEPVEREGELWMARIECYSGSVETE